MLSHILQLAMSIRHTHRTDVITFAEQHFHDHLAITGKFVRFGLDHHAFSDIGDASRLQFRASLYFNQAEAAASPSRNAIQLAESRNINLVQASNFKESLIVSAAHHMSIDRQGYNAHAGLLRSCPTGAQTPA